MRISDWSSDVCSSDLSGALDAVPDLNVCISHGGGFFPSQFGRVEAFAQLNPNNNAKKPLREYLFQIYFDNLIHEVSALPYLVASLGANKHAVGDTYDVFDTTDGLTLCHERYF